MFCRIFIDSDESFEIVRNQFEEIARRHFDPENVEFDVFDSEYFDQSVVGRLPYDAVGSAKYTVEVEAKVGSDASLAIFQKAFCDVIAEARTPRCVVTAACDFEDFIAERTGWNWSEQTPNPPDR